LISSAFSVLAHPVRAADEVSLSFELSEYVFPEGTLNLTKFNVTVMIQTVPQIAAIQVHVEYNDSALRIPRWFEPVGDPQYIFYGKTTQHQPDQITDTNYRHISEGRGVAEVTVLLFPPDQPPYPSGSGKVCIFEFQIVRVPPPMRTSILTLMNSTKLGYTYVFDPDGNEIPGVTFQDSFYTLIPEIIPVLGLTVVVASTTSVILLKRRIVRKLEKT
jgi:hypothetical protein